VNNTRQIFSRTPLLASGLILLCALAHRAPAAIYMQYEGLEGEVTAAGYAGWVELSSLQWGLSRNVATPTGSSADREASAPSFSEIATAKLADKATPRLFGEAVAGEGKTVEIHFTMSGGDGTPFVYQIIKLYNVMVSSFAQSSGGDRPSESLSLNYTKIEFSYIPQGKDGTAGTPIKFIYDIAQGKVINP
jgi:type VI secretion system secreted protein Hcp